MTTTARILWLTATSAALLGAACGGKVAVDPGSGPGGTTMSPGGGGGGGDCGSLGAALNSAIAAAQACNPALDVLQCSGSTIIHDACGCSIVANEQQGADASTAKSLYQSWIETGCGPVECFACPPDPFSTMWGCDPGSMKCQPLALE